MSLTKKKLNDLWRSGYCREMVEHARNTNDTPEDSSKRIAYLREHIPTCADCRHANRWKQVEEEIAFRLGPRALDEFFSGLGPERYPGYRRHLRDIVNEQADELKTPEIQSWLRRITQRGPYQRKRHGSGKAKEYLN